MKKVAFAVLLVPLLVASTLAQVPDWTQVTTASSPSARDYHTMVYDSARGKVVMFGGYIYAGGNNIFHDDTWEYDGTNWAAATPANRPQAREGHGMAYDIARATTVMFGGNGGNVGGLGLASDTWEYDGVNWAQITTANSPSARSAHAIVYDSARGKIVMFGGRAGANYLNDTWEFDGVNWTLATPATSPGGRFYHSMAFDNARGRVVMFGGYFYSGVGIRLNDTWEYDGVDWTQVATTHSPIGRNGHAMAYDIGRSKTVMFGGYVDSPGQSAIPSGDTWDFDGIDWVEVTPANGPSTRSNHAIIYDSARDMSVMFGGFRCGGSPCGYLYLSDTWEIGNGAPVAYASSATSYSSGCGSPALAFSPTANPIIGTTAGAVIVNAPSAFGGVTMGWSDSHLSGIPLLPLDLAFIGMPGCQLWHSNDVFGLPVTPLTATTLQFDLPIPFLGPLLGAHVYLQAYCFAPGENALQIIASNGIDWLIGNQ